jgi:hypothetical protein
MSIWDIVAGPLIGIVNKLIPDKAAAAAAVAQLQQMAAQGQIQEELTQLQSVTSAQSDIDKVEAGSDHMFVAGWRPFVGWTCGSALVVDLIIGPFVTWGSAISGHPIAFPKLDMSTLMPVMMGMLGMGAMRSYEKVQGVATSPVGK